MKAQTTIDQLDPQKWGQTPPAARLALLEAVRENLKTHGDELAASDTKMKNSLMDERLFSDAISKVGTVVPVANTLTACIEVYEQLVHGAMPQPGKVEQVADNLWDITIRRPSVTERLMYGSNKEIIRVKGELQQVSPYDKPAGVIGVLGAGNYSSSVEMVYGLFMENCAVVHKPHHLNEETDTIWAKIMQPLVDHKALTFCDSDQGRELTMDSRLSKIYFTGGTSTANAIMGSTDTELVSECGGNNPCIIVPGDRPWTDKEIAHQAQFIASIGKLNGGAVCGRPQTLVTCKNWPQREAFLDAIRKAIVKDTPAAGTYYPGADTAKEGFLQAYPEAEVLKPENGRYKHADFIFITDAEEESYATANEAFCQILCEVPLDVPATASDFLPRAVEFCNTKLLGTLGSCILIDENTKKAHQTILDQAITDMSYGGIAVNEMPPTIWLSPYLTWGGNEEGKTFVSGHGNFGNALNYSNIEKSIVIGSFMSPGHMLVTNKTAFDSLAKDMAGYAVKPGWKNFTSLMVGAILGGFRKKDF